MKGCALLCWEAVHREGLLNTLAGEIKVHAASEELRKYVRLELDALRLLPPGRRSRLVGEDQEAMRRIQRAFATSPEDTA
jgi:hypothetical protein